MFCVLVCISIRPQNYAKNPEHANFFALCTTGCALQGYEKCSESVHQADSAGKAAWVAGGVGIAGMEEQVTGTVGAVRCSRPVFPETLYIIDIQAIAPPRSRQEDRATLFQ